MFEFLKNFFVKQADEVVISEDESNFLLDNQITIEELIAPDSIDASSPTILRAGDKYIKTLRIVAYPDPMRFSCLTGLHAFPKNIVVSYFIRKIPRQKTIKKLEQVLTNSKVLSYKVREKGEISREDLNEQEANAAALRSLVSQGKEDLFEFHFYIMMIAKSEKELNYIQMILEDEMATLGFTTKKTNLRTVEAFKSCIPLGIDFLRSNRKRSLNTSVAACMFPFTNTEIFDPDGVVYGYDTQTGNWIFLNRFSLGSPHVAILAKTGQGKSFTVKHELNQYFQRNAEIFIIDVEKEYVYLTQKLGGSVFSFSASSSNCINPFDYPENVDDDDKKEFLSQKIQSITYLIQIMIGSEEREKLTAEERNLLDTIIADTYKEKGITSDYNSIYDPATRNKKQPPTLMDLYNNLLKIEELKRVANSITQYVTGSLSKLFNGQTTISTGNRLIDFNVSGMSEQLRPVVCYVISEYIWNKVKPLNCRGKNKILYVDETWYFTANKESGAFLQDVSKRGRKYNLGLTTATQKVDDFLATPYGQDILGASSLTILLRQNHKSEAELVGDIFNLSKAEREFILSSGIGEALFVMGNYLKQSDINSNKVTNWSRFTVQIKVPPDIAPIISTAPSDVAAQATNKDFYTETK